MESISAAFLMLASHETCTISFLESAYANIVKSFITGTAIRVDWTF